MRKSFAVIPALALTAVLTTGLMAQAPAAPAGQFTPHKADEFVIHMPDGTQKLLSSYRGKVVVLAFMYTTCTHCQHLAGVLAKIQSQYTGKDVQVVGVTFDAGATQNVANFIKTFGVNFPCGSSPEEPVLRFLHAPDQGFYVPMLAFIDRTGTIRSQYIVTDGDQSAGKFLEDQETSIPKEIDKYLKPAASTRAAKQAPKS
jgi:peroxiredoxin